MLFMFSSNYCFLTCIQISQEAGQVVWYSCFFKNFPQFVGISVQFSSVAQSCLTLHDPMNCTTPGPCPALQQGTADPRLRQRLLDTPGQVWVSFLWGYCSFLLGPGAQGSVCARQEFVSQSCVSSGGSMVGLTVPPPGGLMPYPGLLHPEPLLLRQST